MPAMLISAQVDADRRYELLQALKNTTLAAQLPAGCLERRLYEETNAPLRLLVIEYWSDEAAMNEYRISGSFRAMLGAIKILGTLEKLVTMEERAVETQ